MMNESVKPPVWFWIVSGIGLLWNGLGIMNYLNQAYMTPEKLAVLPAAEQAMYNDNPAWVTAAFAIAVFGGTIGCILLLLRKQLASILLIISLMAALVQMSYAFFLSDALGEFAGMILPLTIILVGAGLVFLAKKGKESSWLI